MAGCVGVASATTGGAYEKRLVDDSLRLSICSTGRVSLRGVGTEWVKARSGKSDHIPRAPMEKCRIVGAARGDRRSSGVRTRVVRSRKARAAAAAVDISLGTMTIC